MPGLRALQAVLDGDLLTPASREYEVARRTSLARFEPVRPLGVARCASVRDVARTLTFARETNTLVVPRGGGHCFAGRSTTTGLVLDLSGLDAIVMQPDGLARIGAGARLAGVNGALHQASRALPVGCGPTVGIAGLTLGGGIGLMGRRHGLTCDRLVGAQVVLADGRILTCDSVREPELFWALRGAGGGQFGVVTSLVFDTVAEPTMTRFELRWPEAAAAKATAKWQTWAPVAPTYLTADLRISAQPGRGVEVVVSGAALCHADPALDLLDDLIRSTDSRPEQSHQVRN